MPHSAAVFCCRAAPRSDDADMALRRDVRQRIVAGDVEAAQQLLQQRRPQLLAIPAAQRLEPGFAGPAFGVSSPALVADPADGVMLDGEASSREDDIEDGETGRHGGVSSLQFSSLCRPTRSVWHQVLTVGSCADNYKPCSFHDEKRGSETSLCHGLKMNHCLLARSLKVRSLQGVPWSCRSACASAASSSWSWCGGARYWRRSPSDSRCFVLNLMYLCVLFMSQASQASRYEYRAVVGINPRGRG